MKGQVIDVSCFLFVISASMEEIVKLERICNRPSSNLESSAGGSECVHRGMPSVPSTKSGFITSSVQSDHFRGRFPTNTFFASFVFPRYGTSKLIIEVVQLFRLINSDEVNTGRNTINNDLVVGDSTCSK